MADGVQITAGSGTTIATDDNGTMQEQVIKLDLGANSVFTGYVGGESVGNSAFGMYVVPRVTLVRLTDATTGLTVASTNYTANDQVGVLETISSAFRTGALFGTIVGVQVVDQGDVAPTTAGYDIDFWFSSPTLASDNAAYAITDADALLRTARIEMPAFRDDTNNRSTTWWGRVPVVSTDTSLRYSYVTRGDFNFFAAATDLNITVFLEQG